VPDLTRVKIPAEYVEYFNHSAGYKLKHPSILEVNSQMAAVRTSLVGTNTTVQIYVQDETSSRSYIRYGNRPLLSGSDKVEILRNSDKLVNWRRVRELWWKRPGFAVVANDKPYYASVDIAAGFNKTYTLMFNSSDLTELEQIVPPMIRSLKTMEVTEPAPVISLQEAPRAGALTSEAEQLLSNLKNPNKQSWGIFEPSYPQNLAPLQELEKNLDYRLNYVLLYSDFDSGMPGKRLQQVAAEGRIPVLTLQTFSPKLGSTSALTYELLAGHYDEFLRSYARDVAAFSQPLLFRFNNEMNGDWCAYSAYHSSKDASLYVESYKYVYRLFAEAGAENVLWVWNPHDGSFPDFAWNHYLTYYPGDEYVDIVGLTGYNAGTYYKGETWRGFREIYDPLYMEYDAVFPHKALMITEFASNSVGGDKVAWINDALNYMRDYPRVAVSIWWNHIDFDGTTPARIYKLDETPQTLEAFRQGLANYR